jgi:N-methylhydantoinase A
MRFRHQVHQIKVSVPHGELTAEQIEVLITRFIALFEQSFGRGTTVTAAGMEILTFQVVATTRHTELTIKETATGNADPSAAVAGKRAVFFGDAVVETPIFEQARLACGNKIVGPAIVEGANTTLPLHPGQSLTVDRFGNLVIHFPEQGA